MITLEVTSLFPDDVLAQLPLPFRFMTPIETASFDENYTAHRYSRSSRHGSASFLVSGSYKPLSEYIYDDLLTP